MKIAQAIRYFLTFLIAGFLIAYFVVPIDMPSEVLYGFIFQGLIMLNLVLSIFWPLEFGLKSKKEGPFPFLESNHFSIGLYMFLVLWFWKDHYESVGLISIQGLLSLLIILLCMVSILKEVAPRKKSSDIIS